MSTRSGPADMADSASPAIDDERAASTLPASAYVDPEWHRLERNRVFASGWQLVAHVSQLAAPGDHVAADIAGVPLLVVRDADGVLRALHNVCRHRAGPLQVCPASAGPGGRARLRCRYHGWTYGLDGHLLKAPDMPAGPGFDPSAVRLPEARLACWRGLVFASLAADPMPLDRLLSGLPARLRTADLEGLHFHATVAYEIGCNWKVYVDNYLEGYHIPHIHPALNRLLDYRSYVTETGPWHSLQHSPLEDTDGPWGRGQALYVFIWPNTMLNLLPDRLQVNRVLPLAADRCRVEFDYLYPPGDAPAIASRHAADHALSDSVQREDVFICEAVQRGLASGSYRSGPLNPLRERGLAHFQVLLRNCCSPAG